MEKTKTLEYLKSFIKTEWTDEALEIIINSDLAKPILKFLILECQRLFDQQIVPGSTITVFIMFQTILNRKYLRTYCQDKIFIPKFPFLINETCDEDLLVMAKVYVETARIKYGTMSEEWYTALPSAIAMISMAYRSTVSSEDEIYRFEEHLLKCILKFADDLTSLHSLRSDNFPLQESLTSLHSLRSLRSDNFPLQESLEKSMTVQWKQTFETLLFCLLNNPYTPTIPIKEIFNELVYN